MLFAQKKWGVLVDKWTMILLEVEGMWEADSYAGYLGQIGCDPLYYRQERDKYKADRIYALYGYDYFLRFVERCPHIQEYAKKYKPCDQNGGQCTMFCAQYTEGGCKNAAN